VAALRARNGAYSVKLLYGSSFKAPSAEQLYTEPMQPFDVRGNDKLGVQTAHTVELAGSYRLGAAGELSASVFATQVSGRVAYLQRGLYLSAQNLLDEWYAGAELEARYQLLSSVSARLGVGWAQLLSQEQNATVIVSGSPESRQPLYRPAGALWSTGRAGWASACRRRSLRRRGEASSPTPCCSTSATGCALLYTAVAPRARQEDSSGDGRQLSDARGQPHRLALERAGLQRRGRAAPAQFLLTSPGPLAMTRRGHAVPRPCRLALLLAGAGAAPACRGGAAARGAPARTGSWPTPAATRGRGAARARRAPRGGVAGKRLPWWSRHPLGGQPGSRPRAKCSDGWEVRGLIGPRRRTSARAWWAGQGARAGADSGGVSSRASHSRRRRLLFALPRRR
jgi:hypothetical protein